MLNGSRNVLWKRVFSHLVLTGALLAPDLHAEPGAAPEGKASTESPSPSTRASGKASGQKNGPGRAKRAGARRARRERSAKEREERRSKRLQAGAAQLRKRADKLRKRAQSDKPLKDSLRPNAKPRTKESLLANAEKLEAKAKTLEQRAQSPQTAPTATSMEASRPQRKVRRATMRKSRRDFLRKRWGAQLRNPAVKSELAQNARRLARLKQVRRMAQKNKDDATAKRATTLIIQEQARHRAAMRTATNAAEQSKPKP